MFKSISLAILALISIFAFGAPVEDTEKNQAPAEVTESKRVSPKAPLTEQNLRIVYGSTAWNQDSTKPDSAFLFMRDPKSGKIVKIQLEESEPDSSVFAGNFSVSWVTGTVEPEVYIPPRNLKDNNEAIRKFNQLLASNQVKKKPLVIKTDERGLRILDAYDTPEQASRAKDAYEAELKAKKAQAQTNLIKPAVKDQDLAAAKAAEQQALLNKLAIEAAQREADRVRLEQIERQKAEERAREARAASEKEREERRKKAAELAKKALEHYQQGQFLDAEEKFRRAVDLDPENKSYYFRYGVTLYRNDKFNEALVVLKLTPITDPESELEKKYYMGLIHLRLKELSPALTLMQEVGTQKQSALAPSAAFYEGIIHFTNEDYEKAQEPFERVIDTSKDPRLDEQAEEYLDKLHLLIKQKREMSKRVFINGSAGLMYDSNVLLAPDTETAQGTSTKEGDFRLALSGDLEYRPIFTNSHELGVKAMGYYMRSSKDSVALADPMLWNLSVPYSYKGMAFGKGYKMALKPAYEIVYMDENSDGNREQVLGSLILAGDNTFVMKKDWFATYSAEVRQDDSKSASSTGDSNSDAMKITLRTTQTLLLDKAMKEALVGTLAYVNNNAVGKDKFYSRYDLGATYVRPTDWNGTLNMGLAYYYLSYDKKDSVRKDNNITLSAGASKAIKEWVSWNVTGSYSLNSSNESESSYSKFTILTSALFNYAF